jgi:hypothetical protein
MNKILITTLTIGSIVFGGYVYAQNINNGNIEKAIENKALLGRLDETNKEYRENIYRQKYSTLSENVIDKNTYYESIVAYNNINMDKLFGIDFPKEKRNIINDAQKTMIEKKKKLDALYKLGELSIDEYMLRVSEAVEMSLSDVASVLSDEEFYLLFEIEKGEINGAFHEATGYSSIE